MKTLLKALWAFVRTLPLILQLLIVAALAILLWQMLTLTKNKVLAGVKSAVEALLGKTSLLDERLCRMEMENQRRFEWLLANQSVAVATTEYMSVAQLRDIIKEEVHPAIREAVKDRDQKITEVARTVATKVNEMQAGQANMLRTIERLPETMSGPVPPTVFFRETPLGELPQVPTPSPVVREAYEYELVWTATDGTQLPVGVVYFRPYRQADPCTVFWYDTQFHVKLVEARQRDGKTAHYSEAYATTPLRRGYEKTRYPLSLTSSEVSVLEPTERSWFYAPSLSLGGVAYGGKEGFRYGGDVGISVFGYGRTQKDLDWMFLRVGVGGSGDEIIGTLAPVMLRLNLPLTSGLYVWPFAGYGSESEILGGLGGGVRF